MTSLWTPAEVFTLIGLISGVFFTALGILIGKVIDTAAKAKIAIIAAETARLAAQAALVQASENKGRSNQISAQVGVLQTTVAAMTPPTPGPDGPKGSS